MKTFETEHYVFHYASGSKAEKEIGLIAQTQESVFEKMTHLLDVSFPGKIHYYLCQTPEEVGEIYGDHEPCNGFADEPDTVYAVYNEEIQCIGAHEDTHLISYQINRPDCVFLREGLAMKADETWWGIRNEIWCRYFLDQQLYISVRSLFDDEIFYAYGCELTYPIAGAFVEWLIQTYSLDLFLQLYRQKDHYIQYLEQLTDKTMQELEEDFLRSMQSISLTEELLSKIEYERNR